MSSKKNKSKSKRASEGDSSLLLKESSNDSSNLQTSSHEGGSSTSLHSNSFTVIDFIEKGKTLRHKANSLTCFDTVCRVYKCSKWTNMQYKHVCRLTHWCWWMLTCCSVLICLSHIWFKLRHWLRLFINIYWHNNHVDFFPKLQSFWYKKQDILICLIQTAQINFSCTLYCIFA